MSYKEVGDFRLDKVAEELNYLKTHVVIIGFFGSNDSKLLTIVRANEFGAHIQPKNGQYLYVPYKGDDGKKHFYKLKEVNIPARPFIRNAARDNRKKYKQYITLGVKMIIEGKKTGEQLLNELGRMGVAYIQNSSRKLYQPKNAPLTIANKKSDNPLVDTGELQRKVTYKITTLGELDE